MRIDTEIAEKGAFDILRLSFAPQIAGCITRKPSAISVAYSNHNQTDTAVKTEIVICLEHLTDQEWSNIHIVLGMKNATGIMVQMTGNGHR